MGSAGKLSGDFFARTLINGVSWIVGAHAHELLLCPAYRWHGLRILTGYMLEPSTVILAIVRMIVTDAVVMAVRPFQHRLAFQIGDVIEVCHVRHS